MYSHFNVRYYGHILKIHAITSVRLNCKKIIVSDPIVLCATNFFRFTLFADESYHRSDGEGKRKDLTPTFLFAGIVRWRAALWDVGLPV